MNFFSNLRISQKIMLLVAWLGLGFAAMGVAYYLQVEKESQSRLTYRDYNLFEKSLLSGRANLHDYQVLFVQQAQSPSEAGVALWRDAKNRLMADLNQAELLVSKNASLPSVAALVKTVKSLDQSTSTQAPVSAPGYALDKLQANFVAVEALIKQRNKPQELAALTEIQRLHAGFVASADGRETSGLRAFVSDFASTQKNVLRPDAQLSQLIGLLDEYAASLSPTVEDTAPAPSSLDAKLVAAAQTQFSQLQTGLQNQILRFTAADDEQLQYIRAAFIALIFVVVMGTAVGIYFIYKSIVFPLAHMQSVMQRINKGKIKARVKLVAEDELGDLGRAFNSLLDERIQTLQDQSLENEILNNSIISLIRAVGLIARKDLTIRVPVSSDITGTISDAINLLTTETAKTLWQVKQISAQVNNIADLLQKQSQLVMQVAEDERKQVIAAGKALEISAKTMNDIAKNAENADKFAVVAIDNTQAARDTVSRSVAGILNIRETISETEKRIKRLGDRSQEISGIVNLINTIAERTHILALNASMHAASAGEAGKGFAVVADEVQRLAENAREATAEISSMVNNIRVETSDTVNVMNKLIAQVAEGTRLAESAGSKMEDTVSVTRQLVEQVQSIAQSSVQQAELSNRVRDRASIIRSFTEKTGLQLTQQKRHTDSLKEFSEALVEQVNIFSLPKFDQPAP